MSHDQERRSQYQIAAQSLRARTSHGDLAPDDRNLHVMIVELATRVEQLSDRVDELETAARELGTGENTIDYAALDEDQQARDAERE